MKNIDYDDSTVGLTCEIVSDMIADTVADGLYDFATDVFNTHLKFGARYENVEKPEVELDTWFIYELDEVEEKIIRFALRETKEAVVQRGAVAIEGLQILFPITSK